MTYLPLFAACALIVTPAPSIAQMTGPAGTTTVQPNGGGQVRQPPANSAMRRNGGSTNAAPAASTNPMGMAGMGLSTPEALSLNGGATATGQAATRSGGGPAEAGIRIDAMGITQRTPGGRQTSP